MVACASSTSPAHHRRVRERGEGRCPPWQLIFPYTAKEVEQDGIALDDPARVIWGTGPTRRGWSSTSWARWLASSTRPCLRASSGTSSRPPPRLCEPGFILIDKVNQMNNNWFCEEIRATNPAANAPAAHGACRPRLGQSGLPSLRDPFTEQAAFDWPAFRKVVAIFTRMLDNVVEINQLPLPQQREEILSKRRHGMGFLGLGSTLTMLRLTYGSAASIAFTEQVSQELADDRLAGVSASGEGEGPRHPSWSRSSR